MRNGFDPPPFMEISILFFFFEPFPNTHFTYSWLALEIAALIFYDKMHNVSYFFRTRKFEPDQMSVQFLTKPA